MPTFPMGTMIAPRRGIAIAHVTPAKGAGAPYVRAANSSPERRPSTLAPGRTRRRATTQDLAQCAGSRGGMNERP